jgi:hypothetical protein
MHMLVHLCAPAAAAVVPVCVLVRARGVGGPRCVCARARDRRGRGAWRAPASPVAWVRGTGKVHFVMHAFSTVQVVWAMLWSPLLLKWGERSFAHLVSAWKRSPTHTDACICIRTQTLTQSSVCALHMKDVSTLCFQHNYARRTERSVCIARG